MKCGFCNEDITDIKLGVEYDRDADVHYHTRCSELRSLIKEHPQIILAELERNNKGGKNEE